MNVEYLQTWLDVKLKGKILSLERVELSAVSLENLSVDLHSVKYSFKLYFGF